MKVSLRLWGGIAIFFATVMILSGAPGALAASSSPAAPPAVGAASSTLPAPHVTSGSLPEFPTNLTHFIYIVRENHVFDDYLGDCSITINSTCNGGSSYNSTTSGTTAETAPSGDQLLTPNLHSLARQYVVFDNMYSSIDPYSAQAHAYLFTSNSWGSTDSCAPGGVQGTGPTSEWGVYNSSSVKAGNCAWASDSGSQSYNNTGGSIFDRFLGTNVPQSKTTLPFLSDGDIVWELSNPGCSVSSSATLAGDTQAAIQDVTGCTNGWWKNTTSGSPDMPPTYNPSTGVPEMLWECQYACSGSAPNPFLDSYASNSFVSFLKDYGLPTYTFIELFDDHPGNNCGSGQATCIKQNDAAMGQIVGAVENSTYKSNTVIAVTEDDTQNGQNDKDHVNSGRRLPFILIAPHTVEHQGGATSSCGISSTYGSCGYVVHQTFNTSNVLAVMERVEMNVNPKVFVTGGVSPNSAAFPMVQNDYLAEGNPLEPVWLCSGSSATYCNTGVSGGNVTLSSVAISPSSFTVGVSTAKTLTATPTCTGGTCPAGITYTWSVGPSSLGTITGTGASVTFTSGTAAGSGSVNVTASYGGANPVGTASVTVSTAPVTLSSVAIAPSGTVGVAPSGTKTFTVTPTCSATCPSNITYSWTISNTALGSISSPTGASTTFTAGTGTGNLSICVNGTLSGTQKGPSCAGITITNAPPTLTSVTVSPSAGQTLGTGATVSFTAQALDQFGNSISGATYNWVLSSSTVGSLSSTTGSTVTFTAGTTPGATGTIYATATVSGNPNLVSSSTVSLSVWGVTATESTSGGTAPLSVSFTASASGGTSPYTYNWVFGDGNTSTSQNPTHQYTCSGSYAPSVTVTDSAGHTATSSLATISVTGGCGSGSGGLTVKATGTPLSGAVPLTCDFTASVSGGTAPYTFQWTFGDGTTGTGQTSSHTYTSTGPYTVTLYVNDSAGHHATPYTLSVNVNPKPSGGQLAIAVAASPSNGSAPLAVTFAAAVSGGSGTYTSFTWAFGDGQTGAGQYITHTYANARNQPYQVELTVTDTSGDVGHYYTNITVNQATSSSTQASSTTPWWFWVMVLVVVVLAVAIIALLVRGRKSKSPPPSEAPYGAPGQPMEYAAYNPPGAPPQQ